MNIQLFFENQEVELSTPISFPLNKTFQNLNNPTDIIVEYSKSINIPATAVNNKLMANAYRLDRQFITSNTTQNIGFYLDPLKRIPMRLVYNGDIILEGYAKYVSATTNSSTTYYTFNLYGEIGDIFQKMMECVFDPNKLTDEQKAEEDGGNKYIINTPWRPDVINKDLVKNCWDYNEVVINPVYGDDPWKSIGFAPAYRGLYDNFEKDSILPSALEQGGTITTPIKAEEYLKSRWKTNLENDRGYKPEEAQARVDAINFDMILPNGLDEHTMRQFRSYEQKPYIYFRALMNMYQKKCEDLTGYKIDLDPSWFSINNPYWTKLCYMLDYLSVRGNTLQSTVPFTGYNANPWDRELSRTITYNITDPKILEMNTLSTVPFTICLETKFAPKFSDDTNVEKYGKIGLQKNVEIYVDITTTTNGTSTHTYFWGGVDYASAKSNYVDRYKKDNFITATEQTTYEDGKLVGKTFLTIPGFNIPHNANDDLQISYKIILNRHYVAGSYYSFYYRYNDQHRTYIHPKVGDPDFTVIIPNIECKTDWRSNTTCEMKNLYTKDDPMFSVILQYTKMFGLLWIPDYQNKTINITTRQSFFKDYTIENWDDRIDKSKDINIYPVSFDNKYINFNYENVDGYRYSGYKSKYGVNYGEKRIKTRYNFNTESENLFNEKIYPSSASCKSQIPFNTLTGWDTITTLAPEQSEIDFIDAENNDQNAAIQINNFYFRLPNYNSDNYYKISDASQFEKQLDKYFWLSNIRLEGSTDAVITQTLPRFSPVYKSDEDINLIGSPVGCLFNTPNEDYTRENLITEALGNYVYDICWNDYINERYNSDNKKVICYVKMRLNEYKDTKFNNLVMISNQLFMVNKIIDYNIGAETAKVELIQISDINGYTTSKIKFPAIVAQEAAIYIRTYNGVGSASLNLKLYPYITEEKITKITANENSSCFTEGADINGNAYIKTIAITYESDGDYTEEWEIEVTGLGETIKIPIYINHN